MKLLGLQNLMHSAKELLGTKIFNSFRFNDAGNIVFLLIGMCSFGYFAGGRDFAESNIALQFLDFPIFIGEILLGTCLILILISNRKAKGTANIKWILIACYFLFVVAKAFYGYSQWGPLAFRHSALFYYPIFMYVGYVSLNRQFFNDHTISFLVILLLMVQRFGEPFRVHTFVIVMILAVLIVSASNKKLKVFLAIAAVLLFDYHDILYVSRTELVGIGISSFFVISFLLMTLRTKRFLKATFLIVYILALVAFFFLSGQKANFTSLFKLTEMKERYEQQIQKRNERLLTFEPIEYKEVQLYNNEKKHKSEYKVKVQDWKLRFLLEKEALKYSDVTTEERISDALKLIDGEGSPDRPNLVRDRKRTLELLNMLSKKRLEDVNKNKAQMMLSIKTDIINNLDQFYQLDEELKQGIFDEDVKSRRALTERLNQAYNLNTLEERISLVNILQEKLNLTYEIENIILASEIIVVPYKRSVEHAIDNSLFRIYLWEDAFKDIIHSKSIIGIDFGRPFRSRNLEISRVAAGEWTRDGWIAIHNSYIDIVYRSGVIGATYIFLLILTMIKLTSCFFKEGSMKGILLSGALVYWMVMALFGDILEMPYHAIPFWSLLGMTIAYGQHKKERVNNALEE